MRIFIGLMEIANIAFTYAKGFRSLGYETFTVIWRKHPYYHESEYDEVLIGRARRGNNRGFPRDAITFAQVLVAYVWTFLKALLTCDVFIFLFGTSFLPRYLDYAILKILGKRIVSVFLGGDVRYWCAYEQEMRLMGWDRELAPYLEYLKTYPDDFFATKINVVRSAERYADVILSQPGMGQLQIRSYMRVNIPLDLSQYCFHVGNRERPLILHAPSERGVKGTEYVLAAINRLKQEELSFEFQLIEDTTNEKLRELLAQSDIVVDEVFDNTIGALALEAMACGNVVLARYDPKYAHVHADCPVVNVNIETLTDQLRKVITDKPMRYQLGCAGRKYVERHHSHVYVAQQVLSYLVRDGIPEYDFVPTFFQREFVMPPMVRKEEERKMKKQKQERPMTWLLTLVFGRPIQW
jgi:glycosyltransferase involved in cell wall biosynthesis